MSNEMMKREMQEAVQAGERALQSLYAARDKLGSARNLRMEIGSFLSFADFFLDGLVADYMVQSKIADAREQVDDAINRIEKILADVKNRMNGEV